MIGKTVVLPKNVLGHFARQNIPKIITLYHYQENFREILNK